MIGTGCGSAGFTVTRRPGCRIQWCLWASAGECQAANSAGWMDGRKPIGLRRRLRLRSLLLIESFQHLSDRPNRSQNPARTTALPCQNIRNVSPACLLSLFQRLEMTNQVIRRSINGRGNCELPTTNFLDAPAHQAGLKCRRTIHAPLELRREIMLTKRK